MKPTLPGYQIGSLIGEGVCGRVWAAEDPMGNKVAIRSFEALSVNLDIVREVGSRLLEASGDANGLVPIWMQALELKPAMQVTPLLADVEGEQVVPRNLQLRLGDYLGTDKAEALVRSLAKSLASLHRLQVVHGNLKPSNVFFSEEDQALISDYSLGWMPGIDYLNFTDALLYMCPEQLEDPSGLYLEQGYRWDVYAFGVLAYRLLEGAFPRCNESFEDVAPRPGSHDKEGIETDFSGVAAQLMQEEVRPWARVQDESLKGLIMRCLELKPEKRFRDMVEFCDVWEKESLVARHASEMELIARKLRQGRAWKRGLSWGLGGSLAACLALGGGWLSREYILEQAYEQAVTARSEAKKKEAIATAASSAAEKEREHLAESLKLSEAEVSILSESRQWILNWSLAEGGDEMPILVGRDGRLELLDEQYQKLVSSRSNSEKWRRQWQIERALLAIARDKGELARELVADEVDLLGGRGLTTLLLKESVDKPVVKEELAIARNLVKRVDGDDEAWLESALDLVEVRGLEMNGQKDRALRLLAELGERVSNLPAATPGASTLWRTRLQREAADVADGAGREELARGFREAMVADLRNDLGTKGLARTVRDSLEEQFIMVSEGLAEAMYSSGQLDAARKLSEEALRLKPESGHPRVKIALAVHYAVIGGCEREAGETAEALASIEHGLGLLEGPFEGAVAERWRRYREGMLKWQLAGVLGQADERARELAVGQESLSIMRELLGSGENRPSPIQVHHVVGYLCGDLAQACESANEKELFEQMIDQAIESWSFLRKSNPTEPEYAAGLVWCESLRGSKL